MSKIPLNENEIRVIQRIGSVVYNAKAIFGSAIIDGHGVTAISQALKMLEAAEAELSATLRAIMVLRGLKPEDKTKQWRLDPQAMTLCSSEPEVIPSPAPAPGSAYEPTSALALAPAPGTAPAPACATDDPCCSSCVEHQGHK
jgi:hypothetical protein